MSHITDTTNKLSTTSEKKSEELKLVTISIKEPVQITSIWLILQLLRHVSCSCINIV
jgi:hypothetical protein